MAVQRSPRPAATQAAGLKDVAKRAGVSTATVSRVINGTAVVSEDMRRRVEQACATLGYIPNGAARALSTRRTRTIGAVVPTIENDGFARTVFALQRSLQQAGRTLLLANSDYDPAIELEAVMRLLSQGIDGLVLIGGEHDKLLRKHLERKHVPVIEAWTLGYPAVSVGFDNARAASVLADHLLDLGHRRIAVVAGRLEHNDRAAARVLGMRESLRRRGLQLQSEWTTAQPYRVGEGRRAARQLLAVERDRPTAILCGNDQLAFGVLAEARAMGIVVPRDLSVTGFGDSDYAEFLDPPLTTMRVPAEEIGRRAAAYLLSRINGEPAEQSGTIEVELVIRATTAAPP
jgi:LacI family transcriptional regulator, galactose operon repressor